MIERVARAIFDFRRAQTLEAVSAGKLSASMAGEALMTWEEAVSFLGGIPEAWLAEARAAIDAALSEEGANG